MPKADCIKQVSLVSTITPQYKFDKPGTFKQEKIKDSLEIIAPKIKAMLDKIHKLDEADMKRDKHMYKHVIYVDFKGVYAKFVASALISSGFKIAFDASFGLDESKLLTHKGSNFGFLCGSTMYNKTFPRKLKKQLNTLYNRRPDNVYGDFMRILLLDSAHREGIDAFDVKYMHILQDLQTDADRKQAIGRGARMCGQKGLRFFPNKGWKLHVYIYDEKLPDNIASSENVDTLHELYMKQSNIDIRLIRFAPILDDMIRNTAVDKELTENIHNINTGEDTRSTHMSQEPSVKEETMSGGKKKHELHPKPPTTKKTLTDLYTYIHERYKKQVWPRVSLENSCGYEGPGPGSNKDKDGGNTIATFTPTQDFVRLYFQPTSAYKGMLAYHSTGTGKSCCAIATASTSWEPHGYTILYVTRTALKSDIYKNMFAQVCSQVIKQQMKKGKVIPDNAAQTPSKYLSNNWFLPISFKQFSNLCQGKNKIYHEMVKRNGKVDPLKKTLVIIDEAHKMYARDIVGAEKPDTPAIEQAIQHSYNVSGTDSVRVLLMTATPYTSDPMDFMSLLNILRTSDDALPTNFDDFAREYLNDANTFSETGGKIFSNKVAGYVSYLNREHDARSFAIPVVEKIVVPLSTSAVIDTQAYDAEIEANKTRLQSLNADVKTIKATFKESMNTEYERCKAIPVKERKRCKDDIKDTLDRERDTQLQTINAQIDAVKESLDGAKEAKKDATKKNKDTMKNDMSQETMLVTKCKLKEYNAK